MNISFLYFFIVWCHPTVLKKICKHWHYMNRNCGIMSKLSFVDCTKNENSENHFKKKTKKKRGLNCVKYIYIQCLGGGSVCYQSYNIRCWPPAISISKNVYACVPRVFMRFYAHQVSSARWHQTQIFDICANDVIRPRSAMRIANSQSHTQINTYRKIISSNKTPCRASQTHVLIYLDAWLRCWAHCFWAHRCGRTNI